MQGSAEYLEVAVLQTRENALNLLFIGMCRAQKIWRGQTRHPTGAQRHMAAGPSPASGGWCRQAWLLLALVVLATMVRRPCRCALPLHPILPCPCLSLPPAYCRPAS